MIRLLTAVSGTLPSDANIVVFAFEKAKRPAGAFVFGTHVENAFEDARDDGFDGKAGTVHVLRSGNRSAARYLFVGLGPESDATLENVRRGLSLACRRAQSMALSALHARVPQMGAASEVAQAAAEGALLGTYRYTAYQSDLPSKRGLQSLTLIAKDGAEREALQDGLRRGEIFSHAACFARDLINQPPSDATPEAIAKAAKALNGGSVHVRVFGKSEIEKMGMGAFLGVNRGSALPPAFVHLVYRPKGKALRKIGVCGKGITFDSGGLSLKPAKSMETMKYDMTGAATVLALFRALPSLKPPVEVHGFAALTENLPGPRAVKPGDVLKSMRGRTIEVLNTDAEGRLILADALTYACRQSLDEVIDIATLTGAAVIALGSQIAAVLGTDGALVQRLRDAAALEGEKLWELPLESEYDSQLKSPIADLKNIGTAGEAGTIMGGLFLKHFVDKDLPWAHLDVASTGWASSSTPLTESGATGTMVRSLLRYLISYNPRENGSK